MSISKRDSNPTYYPVFNIIYTLKDGRKEGCLVTAKDANDALFWFFQWVNHDKGREIMADGKSIYEYTIGQVPCMYGIEYGLLIIPNTGSSLSLPDGFDENNPPDRPDYLSSKALKNTDD